MGLTRGHIKSHHQDQEGGGPWRLIKLTPEEAEDCYEVPREEYIEFVDKRRRCRRGGLEAHALEMSPETGRRPEVLRSVYSHASVARADGRPPHHRTRSGAILEVTRTPTARPLAQAGHSSSSGKGVDRAARPGTLIVLSGLGVLQLPRARHGGVPRSRRGPVPAACLQFMNSSHEQFMNSSCCNNLASPCSLRKARDALSPCRLSNHR